jgi:arylsulfatase
MGKEAQTFLEFPPMQKGASFNLAAVKEKLDTKMAAHAAQ